MREDMKNVVDDFPLSKHAGCINYVSFRASDILGKGLSGINGKFSYIKIRDYCPWM